MKRKVLLVVALMLALSVTMAAMAYNTATVTSNANLRVTTTNDALLSLTPSQSAWNPTLIGNRDNTATVASDGTLMITFGKSGNTGKSRLGVQPDSVYVWNDMFRIHNNSLDSVKVSADIDPAIGKYLTLEVIYDNQPVKKIYDKGTVSSIKLWPDADAKVKVTLDVPKGATLETITGEFVITAEAVTP